MHGAVVAMFQTILETHTPGRGLYDLTPQLQETVRTSDIQMGLCHLFIRHTSASLVIQENADPDVLTDLDRWFTTTVRDGDPMFAHTDEGPDDMAAHVRAALTCTSTVVPIRDGRLALGTWQAIYLFEHRTAPHRREVIVTLQG